VIPGTFWSYQVYYSPTGKPWKHYFTWGSFTDSVSKVWCCHADRNI